MKEALKIEIEDRNPLTIVHLFGALAAMEVYRVKAMTDAWLREGRKYIALDMVYVSFLDSAGIGLLLQLRNNCQSAGGGVVLVRSAENQVMRTLETASIEKLIPFFNDLQNALNYIQTTFGICLTPTPASSPSGDLEETLRSLAARLVRVEERLGRIEAKLEV